MKIALELPAGIVGDDSDFTTRGYAASSGGRFWRNRFETTKGFESLTLQLLTGVCRTTFGWSDNNALQNFAFGLHNGLMVWREGGLYDITPSGFVAGAIDGTGGPGYGVGGYGEGDYGQTTPGTYFPLTWSFGSRSESFGELFANPRGQTIYKWANDTGVDAAALTNAPAAVTYMLASWTGQISAFGCTDTGGTFNASCIRKSDAAAPTIWTPGTANTAQQFYIEGDGRIVGARSMGRYELVWTDSELHLGTYADGWTYERVAPGGLCGPNAAIVVGSTAFWIGPDLQFYTYTLGSSPQLLVCPIRDDFADNAALGQNDKIVASSVSERGEVLWSYADARDGYENSRVIRLSIIDGAWTSSMLARTSFVDAGPAASPVATTYDGHAYFHERGTSADGSPLSAYLRTGAQYLDQAERCLMLRGLWPDFKDQQGPINLTIYSRFYPQDEPTVSGPYVIAPNTQKVDFLVSGRTFDLLFESNSSPSSWRMGKPLFDAVVTSER